MEVKNIRIGLIYPSPMNPRKTFDEEGLKELADNIEQQGLIQPITVRPNFYDEVVDGEVITTESYEIVCGERRFRAFTMCSEKDAEKYGEIPCIVREMTNDEAREAMLTENLLRKDVDPMEEAAAFAALAEMGQSFKDLAVRFGKSERFIQDRIKLNTLIEPLKQMVTEGNMPMSGAQLICRLNDGNQQKFADAFKTYKSVSKFDCERFVNNLMCSLKDAPWMGSPKWEETRQEGMCKNCQCNTANVGCLFYEMRTEGAKGRCTNPTCYNQKLIDFCVHKIACNKKVVKKDEPIEFGKVLLIGNAYGGKADKATKPLVDALSDLGYPVYDSNEVLGSKIYYEINDERTQKMLENHEAIECISIGGYYGINLTKCAFRPKQTNTNSATTVAVDLKAQMRDKVQADMESAKKKNVEQAHDALKNELKEQSYHKCIPELSQEEYKALLMLMCLDMSYGNPLRNEADANGDGKMAHDVFEAFNGQPTRILRAWMWDKLTASNSYSGTHSEALNIMMKDQYPEEFKKVGEEYAKKLDKRLASLKKKLETI